VRAGKRKKNGLITTWLKPSVPRHEQLAATLVPGTSQHAALMADHNGGDAPPPTGGWGWRAPVATLKELKKTPDDMIEKMGDVEYNAFTQLLSKKERRAYKRAVHNRFLAKASTTKRIKQTAALVTAIRRLEAAALSYGMPENHPAIINAQRACLPSEDSKLAPGEMPKPRSKKASPSSSPTIDLYLQ